MRIENGPSVPDVLPFIRSIYARSFTGCCLHILVDDYNVNQHHADYCLEQAIESGHADCIVAARMLVKMSRTQRLKAARMGK